MHRFPATHAISVRKRKRGVPECEGMGRGKTGGDSSGVGDVERGTPLPPE